MAARAGGPPGTPEGPAARHRIVVDRDRCIGTENCARLAPGTFDVDDDGYVVLRADGTDDWNAVVEAIESCPTQALSLRDDISGAETAPAGEERYP